MTRETLQTNQSPRATFLEAMSRVASTVSVVTTNGPAGRAGITVSSLVSVSADSSLPVLLVCIHKSSAAAPIILENGVLCANVLRADQSQIADVFAGRVNPARADKFAHADWATEVSGPPRLIDPLAAFDCRITHSEPVGLHHVIFAEVRNTQIGGHDQPLIYANRVYGTPAALPEFPVIKVA